MGARIHPSTETGTAWGSSDNAEMLGGQEQNREEQLKPFTCKAPSARNRLLYSALL